LPRYSPSPAHDPCDHLGIDDHSEDGRSASIGRSVFTVILTDDRGKEWRVEYAKERMMIQLALGV